MSSAVRRPIPIYTVIAMLLASAWVVGVMWAQVVTDSNRAFGDAADRTTLFTISCLIASLLFVVPFAGRADRNTWSIVVAIFSFAIVSAALLASDGLPARDAGAAVCILAGITALRSKRNWWLGIALLAVAVGLTPLSAPATTLVMTLPNSHRKKLASLLVVGITVAVVCVVLRVGGEHWLDSLAVSPTLERIGPAYLWTLHARWGDLVAPAIALASIAIAERWFFPAVTVHSREDAMQRSIVIWFLICAVLAIATPRTSITHGILFILPSFLLVPHGWQVVHRLPVQRNEASLTLFTLVASGVFLWMVSSPVTVGLRTMLVAFAE